MNVMVSACLLGDNCKYNGGNNLNVGLVKFLEKHKVIKVCPEVMGGLSAPRASAEIINGRVTNELGIDVDNEFRNGAKIALDIAIKEKVDLVILQSRSPSCGVNKIYDGTFSGKLIEGMGVFAKLLKEHNFNLIDIEDIGGEF